MNNRRFTEFFDRYFHIPLPIVTKHELGVPFPPRNLPIKFGTNPSTIFLVIVVTDRQTHKPTPVKTYSLVFAEELSSCAFVNARCNFVTDRHHQIGVHAIAGMTPEHVIYVYKLNLRYHKCIRHYQTGRYRNAESNIHNSILR